MPAQGGAAAGHLFVTGQPSCGKTTLITRLASLLEAKGVRLSGFYTQEVLGPDRSRIGFDIVTLPDGKRGPLARKDGGAGPKTGAYTVDVKSLEKLALPSMRPSKEVDLYIIDEIGRMELHSDKFREASTVLLNCGVPVFGSVAAGRYGRTVPFCEEIKERPDVTVLNLKPSNREEVAAECGQMMSKTLGVAL